jgi:hypothetical protein
MKSLKRDTRRSAQRSSSIKIEFTQEDYASLIAAEYYIPKRVTGWFTGTELARLIGVTNFPRWLAGHAAADFETAQMRVDGRVRTVYHRKAQQ